MPAKPKLKRYALFGWDYELICPLGEAEVGWYLRWARRRGGPLLGLACGTGRLLCRLAEDGHDVGGVDLCRPMLDIARRHVAELPDDAGRRIRLIEADMANFAIDGMEGRFGLAFVGFLAFAGLYLYIVPQLPSIEELRDVRFQVPLRIYTQDEQLIAEFGEKRRTPVQFNQLPPALVQAFLAAGTTLVVGHNLEWLAPVRELGREIRRRGEPVREARFAMSRRLGSKIEEGGWRFDRGACPGGVMLQMGIHGVGIFLDWLGPARDISGQVRARDEAGLPLAARLAWRTATGVPVTVAADYQGEGAFLELSVTICTKTG